MDYHSKLKYGTLVECFVCEEEAIRYLGLNNRVYFVKHGYDIADISYDSIKAVYCLRVYSELNDSFNATCHHIVPGLPHREILREARNIINVSFEGKRILEEGSVHF